WLFAEILTLVRSNSASLICEASVRFQIRSYNLAWSRSMLTELRDMSVGRIASCASCAPLLLVTKFRGFENSFPYDFVISAAAAAIASFERLTLSVLIYVISPASYNRCANCIVIPTGRYNLRAASCCKVDVVNGAAGLFLAGLVSRSDTLKAAPMFFCKNS